MGCREEHSCKKQENELQGLHALGLPSRNLAVSQPVLKMTVQSCGGHKAGEMTDNSGVPESSQGVSGGTISDQ